MLPNITLVLGIDAKTIEQLKISWPTWKLNRPEMFNWPWIIFYDHEQLKLDTVIELSEQMGKGLDTQYIAWPPPGAATQYESQRAKMLAAHAWVPALHCRTEFHCKLDTDSLASYCDRMWPDPSWFDDRVVVIAPRWNYSKGVGWLGTLEDWGDKVMSDFPALGCRSWPNYSPTALRVGHPRWCSWNSFYRTEFTRDVVLRCKVANLSYDLPVPSQDSTMWYSAERMKLQVRIESMKHRGFNNYPKLRALKDTAKSIMERASKLSA